MKEGRDTVIAALDLARIGDTDDARRLLQNLRKQPELEADACYGLGLLELCRNKVNNSEAYFTRATQLDTSYADAYYQLAKIADSRGDPVTAVLYLKSALAQRPGHALAAEALAEHGVFMASFAGPMFRRNAQQRELSSTHLKGVV
jgi:tetratricopeptide (TPR) repeat protein